MFSGTIWLWVGFNIFVLAMLALDLGVFHRKAHALSLKEASIWSVVWITLAMVFNAGLYLFAGPEPALQFFTGYLIEKSLSVDNIFIFVLLFTFFKVPAAYQHRVLYWGILGALIMRGTLIAVGVALIESFHWIIYLFGAFLIFTGIRMGFHKEIEVHPENDLWLKFIRRFVPVTENYEHDRFFVRRAGQVMVTPLLLVLLVIDTTDLIFAVDCFGGHHGKVLLSEVRIISDPDLRWCKDGPGRCLFPSHRTLAGGDRGSPHHRHCRFHRAYTTSSGKIQRARGTGGRSLCQGNHAQKIKSKH